MRSYGLFTFVTCFTFMNCIKYLSYKTYVYGSEIINNIAMSIYYRFYKQYIHVFGRVYNNFDIFFVVLMIRYANLLLLLQKSFWLDIFLAELLAQVKDGRDVKDVLSFW